MFEIGLILVVAILVFGRDLPSAAVQAAATLQKLRRSLADMRRETGIDEELRRARREFEQAVPRDAARAARAAPRVVEHKSTGRARGTSGGAAPRAAELACAPSERRGAALTRGLRPAQRRGGRGGGRGGGSGGASPRFIITLASPWSKMFDQSSASAGSTSSSGTVDRDVAERRQLGQAVDRDARPARGQGRGSLLGGLLLARQVLADPAVVGRHRADHGQDVHAGVGGQRAEHVGRHDRRHRHRDQVAEAAEGHDAVVLQRLAVEGLHGLRVGRAEVDGQEGQVVELADDARELPVADQVVLDQDLGEGLAALGAGVEARVAACSTRSGRAGRGRPRGLGSRAAERS